MQKCFLWNMKIDFEIPIEDWGPRVVTNVLNTKNKQYKPTLSFQNYFCSFVASSACLTGSNWNHEFQLSLYNFFSSPGCWKNEFSPGHKRQNSCFQNQLSKVLMSTTKKSQITNYLTCLTKVQFFLIWNNFSKCLNTK